MTYKKKLIEVAIPLEAINAASAREKSIRHGHPSTLHLWWARRPLAACRAVLFAQLVDDPSSRVEELLADPKLKAQAEAELPGRVEAWEKSKASAQGVAANAPEPKLEDVVVEIERKRLFAIIEELVKWENSERDQLALLDVTDDLGQLRALFIALDMALADIQDRDARSALRTLSDTILTHLRPLRDKIDHIRNRARGNADDEETKRRE